ncbi:hypothetical protein A2U01_0002349 [Trifolium medium]|uniref:Uncharacterized protein n=1 Tax=Trifolium medium TaxID=97028 RepID=A0A392M2V9_9FABA|nr:hypothetical protein [Trifolium medium]
MLRWFCGFAFLVCGGLLRKWEENRHPMTAGKWRGGGGCGGGSWQG